MFWNNFEKACETKKITPTDAARRVYADDESVLLWERGKAVPSVETLAKLSLLLDTDTDTLLGADNTKRLEGEGVFWNGLVRVCRQKGANPYSVCESIGFSPDAIAMWRRGSIPGTLVIAQILAKLDCSVSDLFYYEENPLPQEYGRDVLLRHDIMSLADQLDEAFCQKLRDYAAYLIYRQEEKSYHD